MGNVTLRLRRVADFPVVLLVLGVLLSGCATDSTGTGGASSAASVTSAPAASDPAESATSPAYRLIDPAVENDVLEAGRYALAPVGPNAGPLAVVDVPDGFISSGPFLFPVGEGSHHVEGCCIVAYWTVATVYKEPCQARGATDPGPSVEDLAYSVIAQRLTTTTKPVRVGGYEGIYLELSGPPDLDLTTCNGNSIAYWEADPGTRYISAPASAGVDRLWILDVAGERVVLDAGVAPGVGKKRIQELTAIVESAQFVQK